jgi:hypothetical protein
MQTMIEQLSEEAGLSQDQTMMVLETVFDYLQYKLALARKVPFFLASRPAIPMSDLAYAGRAEEERLPRAV